MTATPEELEALKEMPVIAMVASVGKNDIDSLIKPCQNQAA